jgi:hypothetical protein
MSLVDLLSENEPQFALDHRGQKLYVRSMTGIERDAWEAQVDALPKDSPNSTVRSLLVVAAACDASGARLFTDAEAVKIAQQWPAQRLKKLFDAAWKFNRLGEDGVEAEKKDSAPEDGAGAN